MLYCCLAVAIASTVVVGCRKEQPTEKPKEEAAAQPKEQPAAEPKEKPAAETKAQPAAEPKEEAKTEAETEAEVVAKLAEADKVDGTVDKVVSKCAACALKMDGKAENALKVSGYTMHFCSAKCKEGFEKDTTKSILALEIPKD
jgi:outer membrane biosynthesis protein TonB